jgi:hypothetical protein
MADLQLNRSSATAQVSHVTPINPKCQFWWGFFGGAMLMFFRGVVYVMSLPADSPWPTLNFRTCMVFIFAIVVPIISGLMSRLCEPHNRFLAAFEGASAPAIFLLMAKDLPF